METKRLERIERFLNSLPESEKDRAILMVDGKLFSWKTALEEFKKGGELSIKIEKALKEKLE